MEAELNSEDAENEVVVDVEDRDVFGWDDVLAGGSEVEVVFA